MFKNKNVLVTGAASGIGLATARKFLAAGAQVFVLDINEAAGRELEAASGPQLQFSKVNVAEYAEVEKFFRETIEARSIHLHVLVNNAGIEIAGEFHDFPPEDYDRLMNVNVKSMYAVSKFAVNNMLQHGGGAIVNLASVASVIAWPKDAIYNASKAAVHLLTKSIAVEYAARNIRANCVAPAIIDTPMTERSIGDPALYESEKKRKGEVHPMRRLGQPEEVAEAILFLASEKASFITGAILPVDGGYLSQ